MSRALVLAALLAGCTTFEDEAIVIDLRVLAMSATVPEQIVDVDFQNPQMPAQLLPQLVPTRVCALIADPTQDRRVRYTLTLCSYGDGYRCSPDADTVIGSGVIDDPDTATPHPEICATVNPNANLLGVVLDALDGDQLYGLGGIYYIVELAVGGAEADPALDQYAAKALVVAPRIPVGRERNNNPSLDRIDVTMDGAPLTPLGVGRCVDAAPALTVRPRDNVRFTPIETPGAREDYLAPTLDGTGRQFTESLTYQWVASGGSFSQSFTGGPRDVSGNPAPLFTDWRAPSAEDLAGPTDISLWVVQRDERLGVRWYESCIRVTP